LTYRVNEADCHVTYDIASEELILWIPEQRPARAILYMGPVITRKEALNKYEIDDARPEKRDLQEFLQKHLENPDHVLHILHARDISRFKLDGCQGIVESQALLPAMNACRVIKDDYEIECIKQANRITAEAHTQALKNCKRVSNEAAIHGIYTGTCLASGAQQQAYHPIIGAGQNAATLHYVNNDEDLKGKQLLLMDAGCEWNCYACDVTRTFPLSDDWQTKEARAIYKLVEKIQESCIAVLRPGVVYRDVALLAHHIAVEGLLELGILHNGTLEEIIKARTSEVFFPHGLGHHLGLEVHDVEESENPLRAVVYRGLQAEELSPQYVPAPLSLSPLLNLSVHTSIEKPAFLERYSHLTKPPYDDTAVDFEHKGLQPGMVITVEPGM
jgi:Xaa-Pro dipeptidase